MMVIITPCLNGCYATAFPDPLGPRWFFDTTGFFSQYGKVEISKTKRELISKIKRKYHLYERKHIFINLKFKAVLKKDINAKRF